MINRTQVAVLGFFGAAWLSFVAILIGAPAIYDDALKLPSPGHLGISLPENQ